MKTLGLIPLTRMGLQKFLQKPNLFRGIAVVQSRTISQDTDKRSVYDQHQKQYQQDQGSQDSQGNYQSNGMFLLAASTAAAAIAYGISHVGSLDLHADDNTIAYENRIRQYSTVDQIFQYFSTYLLSQKNMNGGMSRVVMMSPMDLFNAITPESPGHVEAMDGAAGPGNFITVEQDELASLDLKKSPIANSILNEIGKNGLLTYNDFCFLVTILSTPNRHIQTAFEMFDITGDSKLEANEFSYIADKLAFNVGGYGDYRSHMKDKIPHKDLLNEESGLLNYLFGKDRQDPCDKEKFLKFHQDLQDEIIELEFREYDKENTGRISELDLGKFLLKNSKIPPKTEKRMLKRIAKIWPSKKRGVSLGSFKNLYQTLAGGEDLQRAISYMDEGQGIDYEEFRKISFWVSKSEMSDHVAKVMFVLLDDDENGRLTIEEIQQILLTWRKARGFDKLSINITVGPK